MFSHQLKSQALQAVPYQQCDGFVVFHMTRRFPAPQHVVIHTGQIVMNERIGMDQLHRSGQRSSLALHSVAQLSRSKSKQRTHPLSST